MHRPLIAALTAAASTTAIGAAPVLASRPAATPKLEVAGTTTSTSTSTSAPTPSAADQVALLRNALRERVRDGYGTAMVAGILRPDGRTEFVTAGRADGSRRLSADSVFEIGSITKTFTATLLADAARRGEVTLTQPVRELLPPGSVVPAVGARQITLQDLATQTSGLPRLPADLLPAPDPNDPYAAYTRKALLKSLAATTLTHTPGEAYEYSNFGFGLLGDALSMRLGAPFERLVQDRVAGPLGLTSTGVTLTPEQGSRLVRGHDGEGAPAAPWSFDSLAGAGALRSTAADLLRFASANLAAPSGPGTLGAALADAQAEHWRSPELSQGLAWVRQPVKGRTIVWHNGGTAGFSSFLGLDPSRRTAVVVLSDSASIAGATDVGIHALEPSVPLSVLPHEVKLPVKALERLTGRYRVDGTIYEIARRGSTLVVTAGGTPVFVLRAASAKRFFSKSAEVDVSFDLGRSGRATGLTVTIGGESSTGERL